MHQQNNNSANSRKVGKLKITIDRDLCIGAASCIAVAPKAYELDGEAKAVFLDTIDEETEQALIDSAKSCPVAAIIIHDEDGNQIFP